MQGLQGAAQHREPHVGDLPAEHGGGQGQSAAAGKEVRSAGQQGSEQGGRQPETQAEQEAQGHDGGQGLRGQGAGGGFAAPGRHVRQQGDQGGGHGRRQGHHEEVGQAAGRGVGVHLQAHALARGQDAHGHRPQGGADQPGRRSKGSRAGQANGGGRLDDQARRSSRMRMPWRGLRVISGCGSTGWPGTRRGHQRRAMAARASIPSVQAKASPMQRRGPPPKGK